MSMVALSVSICTMMSPSSSSSPTSFSHLTILPVSIVGERAGRDTRVWGGRSGVHNGYHSNRGGTHVAEYLQSIKYTYRLMKWVWPEMEYQLINY